MAPKKPVSRKKLESTQIVVKDVYKYVQWPRYTIIECTICQKKIETPCFGYFLAGETHHFDQYFHEHCKPKETLCL